MKKRPLSKTNKNIQSHIHPMKQYNIVYVVISHYKRNIYFTFYKYYYCPSKLSLLQGYILSKYTKKRMCKKYTYKFYSLNLIYVLLTFNLNNKSSFFYFLYIFITFLFGVEVKGFLSAVWYFTLLMRYWYTNKLLINRSSTILLLNIVKTKTIYSHRK